MRLPAELAALQRRACVAQVGGFRPPDDALTSWMGTVRLGDPEDNWPVADDTPMHGMLQLLVRDLPVRPAMLDDVEMLTLFVAEELPIDTPNGVGWCLRTYDAIDGLRPLEPPSRTLKPFPLAFSAVEDWPDRDDVPSRLVALWDEHADEDEQRYRAHEGLKVGGWPSCVQSEVEWYDGDGGAIPDLEFVLQVDSDYKVGFVVADAGVFYVGRRRGTDTWHATWQSA